MSELKETTAPPAKIPFHYLEGQQPTRTGERIHSDLSSIDFSIQLKGGKNTLFEINPILFKNMDEYKKLKEELDVEKETTN